jgi:hypothetical protein
MVRVMAGLTSMAAFAIAAGSWMLTDAAHARWEERVERQCTNRQVCRPVQKTQQDCRVEQACRQQPQPTTKCQMQNVCRPGSGARSGRWPCAASPAGLEAGRQAITPSL